MGKATAWRPIFMDFLSRVQITSKDTGKGPLIPFQSQLRFMDELCEGLEAGQRHFVCLKARQLGISTFLLPLDVFWLSMFPGIQGALIADTDDNKQTFRTTISEFMENLPSDFRIPVAKHNRNELMLTNGSRLQYMSAGTKKNSGLGRSRALNFVHGTELCRWGDPKGIDSLEAAMSTEHPNRLYMFESTALGYNMFYDEWRKAVEDPGRKAFFIGWWAKDTYRLKPGTPEYATFWEARPQLTDEEAALRELVLSRYGYEIADAQFAWYRLKESGASSAESLKEEFPSTEEESWQVTGSAFFQIKRVTDDINFVTAHRLGFSGYKVELGETFNKLRVIGTTSLEEVDLRVWEDPKPGGRYVMGVDPAYGSSENADRSVISIWRCYADKLIQVAEYATPDPESHQCAWVMAYLAACYRDCMINLELTGPGRQVMSEVKYIKQQMKHGPIATEVQSIGKTDALNAMRWFLWTKVDALGGGFCFNFQTTSQTKITMLNRMRDAYNTGQFVPRGIPLLNEMLTLVQEGDAIQASGRNKDDRVMAGGLACYAWVEWVRNGMLVANRTFELEQAADKQRDETKPGDVVANIIPGFFAKQQAARSAVQMKRLLEGTD